MKNKIFFIFVLYLFCAGCEIEKNKSNPEPEIISTVNVGTVLDIEYQKGTFTTLSKTIIKTEKLFFVLTGIWLIPLDKDVMIDVYSNGENYFYCEGEKNSNLIW